MAAKIALPVIGIILLLAVIFADMDAFPRRWRDDRNEVRGQAEVSRAEVEGGHGTNRIEGDAAAEMTLPRVPSPVRYIPLEEILQPIQSTTQS